MNDKFKEMVRMPGQRFGQLNVRQVKHIHTHILIYIYPCLPLPVLPPTPPPYI